MFLGNLYLNSRPTPIQFFFSSFEAAMEASQHNGESERVTIVDDYGQTGTFKLSDVSGWLVIDFAKTMTAEADKQLILARATAANEARWLGEQGIANLAKQRADAKRPGLVIDETSGTA